MNRIFFHLSVWAFAVSAVSVSRTQAANESVEHHLLCSGHRWLFADPGDSNSRKYAPDRLVDILHLSLDITPHFSQRTLDGKCTIKFRPIAEPLDELRLNGVDLDVKEVTGTVALEAWEATKEEVVLTFEKPILVGQEVSVTIAYSASPEEGFYFRTTEMGYPEGDDHLWTQGEAILHRHWFPCFDSPNEKMTSDVICRVPEGMTVLSNGRLLSETKDSESDRTLFHWSQDQPHVTYLISIVAGYFEHLEDRHGDLPLAFYTPPSYFSETANSFRDTRKIIEFFEEEIGVTYPWDKYFNVCVTDFTAGGMENTSLTTLTTHTLFSEASENLRSSQGLDAHEAAHQWFGDLVTCKDWSHLWLNEGFATYYAHLYDGYKNGNDYLKYGLYRDARNILSQKNDVTPMVHKGYNVPMDQFSFRAYPKGSWILHMLRSQLGTDLFRKGIETYLNRHRFGNVVTEDLNSILEELSGKSLDRFFDQWVYHASTPDLNISYSWNQKRKLAKLSVKQSHKTNRDVLLFELPLTIEFRSEQGKVRREVVVRKQNEDFYFSLSERPEVVRLDPDYTLLADIKFSMNNDMVEALLKDDSDMIGRMIALKQLKGKSNPFSIKLHKKALNEDPFHGIRIQAAQSLADIDTEESLEILTESMDQNDARVRQAVASAIGARYNNQALDAVRKMLSMEKNPDIQSRLIRSLGKYSGPSIRQDLLKYIDLESFRNRVFDAAVAAMKNQDDPVYIPVIKNALQEK
ncbi:MAG TPA: hypothetical protein EYG38_12835, partial [Verrucomicrobia bacterium]|nr:hypothetical protein [Verrucomicrobiota bacterium]